MASPKNRMAARLVRKTLEFNRLAPWREFTEQDLFLIDVPDAESPMVAYVMGQYGVNEGFVLLRGSGAYDLMLRLQEGEPQEQVSSEQSMLGFSLDPLGEIPPSARQILNQAGFVGRRETRAPLFISRLPGGSPRIMNSREARVLVQALSGFLDAWQAGELRPRPPQADSPLQRIALSGGPAATEFRVSECPPPPAAPIAPIEADLGDLERLDEIWLATLSDLVDDDPERGHQLSRVLVVLERDSGEMLCFQQLQGLGVTESAQKLLQHCRGDNPAHRRGLPRVLRFSSKSLMAPVRGAFEAAGVRVEYVPRDVRLRGAVAALGKEAPMGKSVRYRPYGPADPVLAHWKAEELDLIQEIGSLLVKSPDQRDRAIEVYFGDRELGDRLLDDLEQYSVEMAFCEWWAAHYRHEKGASTAIETMLADGDRSEDQRALLSARRQARPSLFHVEDVDPGGGTLRLLDILTGEAVRIHDQSLSKCVGDGLIMPLSLLPAGPFVFALMQGPPIPPLLRDSALTWLESHGLPPNIDAFGRDPHLLGSLWDWFDQAKEMKPPELANTDGDPIEWHRACFSLQDPGVLERALQARDDIQQQGEDEPGVFVWTRPDTPEAPALGPSGTVLGRVEIIGDEALVEVNSRARLERAQEWLEQVPGVKLVSVQIKDPLRDVPPLDDRLPHPEPDLPPAELVAALRDVVERQAMRWLDESLPALRGMTPRQAVATAEGRDRVLLMIRCWPSQSAPDGTRIAPPREAMLRELGLE